MNVIEWLLDSDPAIRWQVMQGLTQEAPEVVAAERSKVATQGWGARLLSLQAADGQWGTQELMGAERPAVGLPQPATRRLLRELQGIPLEGLAAYLDIDQETLARFEEDSEPAGEGLDKYRKAVDWMWNVGTYRPEWTSTTHTLAQLRDLGLDPDSEQAQRAVALVRDNCKWDEGGQDYFDGEVEPCINGKTVAIGAYFRQDVSGIVDRLLGEQLEDGGWNCEAHNGSVRSSFHTTIEVLEGLLEYEHAHGGPSEVRGARLRAQEYLLERGLFRRLSTGQVIDEDFMRFAYPPRWHYDVLRGLDYLRRAEAEPDARCAEAVALVRSKRQPDGRWLLENSYPGRVHFALDGADGEPSRWNTLRALRVLAWYEGARTRN